MSSRKRSCKRVRRLFPQLYKETVEERTEDGAYLKYKFDPDMVEAREKERRAKEHRQKAETMEIYGEEISLLTSSARRCAACRNVYTEAENFNWNCRFHPGKVNSHTGIYSCCSASVSGVGSHADLIGCTRCDHRPSLTKWTRTDQERIPLMAIEEEYIEVHKQAIIRTHIDRDDPTMSYCLVTRFNTRRQ